MHKKTLIRLAMVELGKRTSPAKTKAVRLNAKKGGWPKGKKRSATKKARSAAKRSKTAKAKHLGK